MLESERKVFEKMDGKSPMSKYWMPLVWATNIINRARKEGLITSDHIVQTLLVELSDIRRRLGALIGYDTVCVPLVYTQVCSVICILIFSNDNDGKPVLSSGTYNEMLMIIYAKLLKYIGLYLLQCMNFVIGNLDT